METKRFVHLQSVHIFSDNQKKQSEEGNKTTKETEQHTGGWTKTHNKKKITIKAQL